MPELHKGDHVSRNVHDYLTSNIIFRFKHAKQQIKCLVYIDASADINCGTYAWLFDYPYNICLTIE